MSSNIVVYNTPQGDQIQLSPAIVRQYLVSGNGSVTDQEVMMFLSLCRYQHLNPFLREAYLVKFGSEPATIITGKEVFTKRAAGIKECKGFEAGVIVQTENIVDYRKGTLVLTNEKIVGGWAKVYREDWDVPLEISVSLNEYLRKKRDGTPMASWASMPATMIRKVALVQALREAFPEDFGGMYAPEEMPVDTQTLPDNPVNLSDKAGDQLTDPETGEAEDAGDIPPAVLRMADKAGMTTEDFFQFVDEKYGKPWRELTGNEKSEVTKHLHELGQAGA